MIKLLSCQFCTVRVNSIGTRSFGAIFLEISELQIGSKVLIDAALFYCFPRLLSRITEVRKELWKVSFHLKSEPFSARSNDLRNLLSRSYVLTGYLKLSCSCFSLPSLREIIYEAISLYFLFSLNDLTSSIC